jgi:protein phosphatase
VKSLFISEDNFFTFPLLNFFTFLSEKKMTENSIQMISSAITDRGLSEKRPQNEDSYLEMPERGIFAVADGVGGAQAGDTASQMAMEILAEAFMNLPEGGDAEDMMQRAITHANLSIYQMSHDLPQLSTMATTVVALHVNGNIATIGHAGDSRLYRLDSKGNLFRETQDHSVVEEEVRAGRMTREQAENHPSKNVISRALGAEETVEVDMKTIMFEPNTTFLLCSDGVTRHIPDVEIRDLLALPHPPVLICGQIKDICYERGAEDNLTAVIVRVSGSAADQTTDYEENTIASARDSMAETLHDYQEVPTQNLSIPAEVQNYQPQAVAVTPPPPAVTTEANSIHISGSGANKSDTIRVERDEKTYTLDEKNSSGILGKFFTFLLGLIAGTILGALGLYLWSTFNPPEKPAEIKKMETENIAYKSFEDSRRNVDSAPQKYIDTNNQRTDNNAEDLYLLGRAYLLTGDSVKAKEAFNNAKGKLKDFKGDAKDKAMLTNEINFGLAMDNPFSQGKLKEEKKSSDSSNTANGNANANQ